MKTLVFACLIATGLLSPGLRAETSRFIPTRLSKIAPRFHKTGISTEMDRHLTAVMEPISRPAPAPLMFRKCLFPTDRVTMKWTCSRMS